MFTHLCTCGVEIEAELWVKKKCFGKNLCVGRLSRYFSFALLGTPLPHFHFSPDSAFDSFRKTSVFLSNKTLTCFGGEGWFAFIWPFKIFYTPTFWPNTLAALKYPCFCFLFRREACSVSAWGVFRHCESPNATFFLHCTRSHSSFSFFVWLSHKSIQISEKENDEVIAWQRSIFLGRGKDRGGRRRGRNCGEVCTYVFFCSWVPEVACRLM